MQEQFQLYRAIIFESYTNLKEKKSKTSVKEKMKNIFIARTSSLKREAVRAKEKGKQRDKQQSTKSTSRRPREAD